MHRWVPAVLGGALVLAALLVLLFSAGPVSAAPATGKAGGPGITGQAAATATVDCSAREDAASCDADGDVIPDGVEVAVCGSGTCATGREDSDRDGIPDWTEVTACGDTKCADPAADTDADGVPDFAEELACGSATCSNGRDDADGNGVADWIDVVICGTAGCATGEEDFDGNGVSDAAELAACVKDTPRIFGIPVPGTGTGSGGFLASTGFQGWIIALAGAVLLGVGALLIYRRKTTAAAAAGTDADALGEGSSTGGNA